MADDLAPVAHEEQTAVDRIVCEVRGSVPDHQLPALLSGCLVDLEKADSVVPALDDHRENDAAGSGIEAGLVAARQDRVDPIEIRHRRRVQRLAPMADDVVASYPTCDVFGD